MRSYFESLARQNDLRKILTSWEGTPFRHWCGVKGEGCDCIHFVTRVLEEVGYLMTGLVKIPWYPADWHLHNEEELLLAGLEKYLKYDNVGCSNPINGDILLFNFGKTNSHTAFFMDDHLYHAVFGIGVLRSPWMDKTWYKRKRKGIRLLT